MKKSKVFTIVLAVALALSFFISCSSEVSQDAGTTTVRFAPTSSKALNQSEEASGPSSLSHDVNNYRWQYYCSSEKPEEATTDTDYDSLNWQWFDNVDSGLGTIPNLGKGQSYYFGLRGWTTETDALERQLIWEGFHYGDDNKSEKVKLTSKNQLITITVYSKGQGYLYFNIVAPVVTRMGFSYTSGSDTINIYDKFVYTYKSFDDSTSGTDEFVAQSYDSTNDRFVYQDDENEGKAMPVGDYLLTIQQYTWDCEKEAYVKVTERKQVLILNIVSGVDTVIGGSLDSTSPLSVFDYDARGYTEAEKKGLLVRFHGADYTSVTSLDVTVTDSNGKAKKIYQFDNVVATSDSPATISWSDSSKKSTIYVNGYKLNVSSTEGGYYLSTKIDASTGNAVVTKLYNLTDDDNGNYSFMAEGTSDNEYMVTIVAGDDTEEAKSISFTITASAGTKTVSETTSKTDAAITLSNTDAGVSVTIPESLSSFVFGDNDSETITLSVVESETIDNVMNLEITLTTGTNSELTDLNDFVEVVINVEKETPITGIVHDGKAMEKVTTYTNYFTDLTTSSDTNEGGYYYYDSANGKLYLKTTSFSPFKISLGTLSVEVGDKKYASLASAVEKANPGSTIKLLANVTVSSSVTVDKELILDLNGQTIKGTTNNVIFVDGGDLTIKGTGTINGPDYEEAFDSKVVIKVQDGKLTVLNGVTINAYGSDNDKKTGMYGIYVKENGTLILGDESTKTGPEINSFLAPIGLNNLTSPATVKIYGGSYTATYKGNTYDNPSLNYNSAIYAAATSDITINGGTFSGKYAISAPYKNAGLNLVINDGTFKSEGTDVEKSIFVGSTDGSGATGTRSIKIFGGNFKHTSDTDYKADSCTVTTTTDWYVVQ